MESNPAVMMLLLILMIMLHGKSTASNYFVSPAILDPAPYPEWAHHHWVWLSNDRAKQSSMMDYATEYIEHGIKVGAVDIDSGWSTGYNDFVFNPKKYPDPQAMMDFFHNQSIAVILWATSMVDTDSPNFNESYNNGYFIRDVLGQQVLFDWWHGKGGLIDYTNKAALQWWHSQMDQALKYGIDGWKCDGTDPYILELIIPEGSSGVVTRKEYSDAYYGDFYDYTRTKNGNNTLIMSRAVDGYGPIYLDFSPRRVVFSGWTGDADPTFEGLKVTLKKYLQSAWAGYVNFGSDIGGYRSGEGELGRTKELLIRWAQLGAFSPLMENGGNKEHRPWAFDNETLEIYKQYVDIHYQLVPYLLSTGTNAYYNKKSSLTPLAAHQNFIEKFIDDFIPETYNYLLGEDILVAPVYTNDTIRDPVKVKFPEGANWVNWWNASEIYRAGDIVKFSNISLYKYTVFCKQGKIIPLRITERTPPWGCHHNLIGYLRLLLYTPLNAHSSLNTTKVHESNGHGIMATYWMSNDMMMMHFNVTAHSTISVLIEVHNIPGPVEWVVMNDIKLQRTALTDINTPATYHYDENTNSIFMHPLNAILGISITVCMF